MLITDLKSNITPFEAYSDLMIEQEINKLDILTFYIPEKFIAKFKNEYLITTEEQIYVIKNIEPYYNNYRIECKQDISDWYTFNQSLNFPYKSIGDILNGVKPKGWQVKIVSEIKEKRTITADHKMSSEVIKEVIEKFNVEVRFDNINKTLTVGYELAKDDGVYFSEDLNIINKSIKTESFEFATRIVPEGMNGLQINQINDGKNYLENKSYSPVTKTYYWKDERYTNIKNLRDDAQKKLDELSKPYKSIEIKVQDLSKAVGVYNLDFNLGDYVHLLDKDNQIDESYRIVNIKRYKNKPFATEITLNNKILNLVDDEEKMINLTTEMWEKTRVRFETTENSIKGFVETQQRYTDDSFKTYKAEREMTDRRIYEAITESTTYVDPVTGQTKPIIDKQLEIDKSLDGIKINLTNLEKANQENIDVSFDKIKEEMESKFTELDTSITNVKGDVIAYKQAFDIANGKVNSEIISLRQEIDDSGDEIKKYVSENYSTRTQTDAMISDKIGTIKSQMDLADTNLKKYVEENYSTRTQTEQAINDSVKSIQTKIDTSGNNIKKYVEENYATKTLTDTMIRTQVKSVKYDVEDAKKYAQEAQKTAQESYTEIIQTKNEIQHKVSEDDVYSLIQQMPSYVKIKAENIDLTGNTSIVGTFSTASYGKRVLIEGSDIIFADSRNHEIGRLSIDDNNCIHLHGEPGEGAGIRLNNTSSLAAPAYRNINNGIPTGVLFGTWTSVEMQSTLIATSTLFVDARTEMFGDVIAHDGIQVGPYNLLPVTSGSQLQVTSKYYSGKFIIDFKNKNTFWV